jgi:hypothetical protein
VVATPTNIRQADDAVGRGGALEQLDNAENPFEGLERGGAHQKWAVHSGAAPVGGDAGEAGCLVVVGDVGEFAEHHGSQVILFNVEVEPDGGPRRLALVMASR